jgi:hypothetical protein
MGMVPGGGRRRENGVPPRFAAVRRLAYLENVIPSVWNLPPIIFVVNAVCQCKAAARILKDDYLIRAGRTINHVGGYIVLTVAVASASCGHDPEHQRQVGDSREDKFVFHLPAPWKKFIKNPKGRSIHRWISPIRVVQKLQFLNNNR